MTDLVGKVAIVTGGSRGAGRGIVTALIEAGMSVAAFARDRDTLDELKSSLGAAAHRCLTVAGDVADEQDVASLIATVAERFGRLDALINNAGIGAHGTIEEVPVEQWDRVLAVNLRGPYLCSRAALRLLRESGGGHIISIGSGAGKQGYAGMTAYCASKFGLIGLSQALAAEVGDQRIKVTVLNPGTIMTGFGRGGGHGKVLHPEDVAEAVLYL
ncbi:MAG TPA: SDR family oxidoreductase, partial [Chloroflexota bacterium]|nr:SDR family oxidoreductase [Chloroflexota bacterium]